MFPTAMANVLAIIHSWNKDHVPNINTVAIDELAQHGGRGISVCENDKGILAI